MTAHCALSKLNQCPAHWGSHQSSCRTPGPLGLMAHPRHPFIHAPLSPSSPTPGSSPPPFASLNYSSVYVSCQASVKNATAILEHQAGWGDGVNQCRHWVNNLHRYAEKYTPDLDFLQVVDKHARQQVESLTLKDKRKSCFLDRLQQPEQNMYATSNLTTNVCVWCHYYKKESFFNDLGALALDAKL